jgi:hypothetical protein
MNLFKIILIVFLLKNCTNPNKTVVPSEPIPEEVVLPQEEKWEEVASILPVSKNLKWIPKSEKLEFYIEPKFVVAEPFNDKISFVKYYEKQKLIDAYMNSEGQILFKTKFDYPNFSFNYGICRFLKNRKYGFFDKKGNIVIQAQFEDVSDFLEPIAWAKKEGKYGYIGLDGNWLIQPSFHYAENFSEDLALVTIGNRYGYINSKGEFIIPAIYENASSFSEGLASVKKKGKYIFIDKKGRQSIKNSFDFAGSFHEGLARVKNKNKFGYINKKSEVVIPFELEEVVHDAYNFKEDRVVFVKNNKYGYMDRAGRIIIEPKFDFADYFVDGVALVSINQKVGYINQLGEYIIKPQFENGESFSEGFAAVKKSELYGYIQLEQIAKQVKLK